MCIHSGKSSGFAFASEESQPTVTEKVVRIAPDEVPSIGQLEKLNGIIELVDEATDSMIGLGYRSFGGYGTGEGDELLSKAETNLYEALRNLRTVYERFRVVPVDTPTAETRELVTV